MARDWYVEKKAKRIGRPSKFNDNTRALILRCCYEGMNDYQIANAIGVLRGTLGRWKKNDDDLKEAMIRIRKEVAKGTIEAGLFKLASGYREEEVTTESIAIDDEGNPVKRKITEKYYPPSVKAMEMLASKHCPNEYIKKEVSETNINVRITQRDRALSLEERLAILNKDRGQIVEVVESTAVASNSNDLEDNLSPPCKDE